MQSNGENGDFSSVDFAAIRGLDPGGMYQVINIRNQEFIDHTFLGHMEIQDAAVVDVMPAGAPEGVPANGFQHANVIVDHEGKVATFIQSLPAKQEQENGVIVSQKKDNLATLTPIGEDWSARQASNFAESLDSLPPLAVIQREGDGDKGVPEEERAELRVEKTKVELPHKKRLPRKSPDSGVVCFNCQLCGKKFTEQFAFYSHLRSHYEAKTKVRSVGVQVDEGKCEKDVDVALDEEFSDPEDMLEGIRGVVDKVQEQSGEEESQEGLGDWYAPEEDGEEELNAPEESDNFVLYINKTDLVMNPVFSAQINQTVIEKALMDAMPDLKDGAIEAVVKINPEVVRKTRSSRRARSAATQEAASQGKERLRKRKPKEASKGAGEEGKRTWKKLSKCDECQREFNSRNALRYHVLSHTGHRPHQCEVCGKAFYSSSALKVHKRLHTGVRPYSCKHCGRMFRQWGDLKYHITSKHSEEKNHQCEFCGKDFARRYSLVIHRRIHTGERNYACDYCSKSFRASSYLQNHRKIHTGEKPYTCTICTKKFRVRGDMKRHMNTHFPKADTATAAAGVEKAPKESKKAAKKKSASGEMPAEEQQIAAPAQEGIKVELDSVAYDVQAIGSDEEGSAADQAGQLPHLRHKSAFAAPFFPRN